MLQASNLSKGEFSVGLLQRYWSYLHSWTNSPYAACNTSDFSTSFRLPDDVTR